MRLWEVTIHSVQEIEQLLTYRGAAGGVRLELIKCRLPGWGATGQLNLHGHIAPGLDMTNCTPASGAHQWILPWRPATLALRGCHTVPTNAFRYWPDPTAVQLSPELAVVEQCAFSVGGMAVDFELALALTYIGMMAFWRCGGLQAVSLPASLVEIDNWAFAESSMMFLDLSACSNLVAVGPSAFKRCVGLHTATLGGCSKLRGLEKCAFMGCTTLASLTLPDGLTSVGNKAFLACISLATVAVPSKLETVGSSAFRGCTALVAIDLSGCASLRTIDPSAFRGCSALRRVRLPPHFQHEVLELPVDCVVTHGPVTQEPVYRQAARWAVGRRNLATPTGAPGAPGATQAGGGDDDDVGVGDGDGDGDDEVNTDPSPADEWAGLRLGELEQRNGLHLRGDEWPVLGLRGLVQRLVDGGSSVQRVSLWRFTIRSVQEIEHLLHYRGAAGGVHLELMECQLPGWGPTGELQLHGHVTPGLVMTDSTLVGGGALPWPATLALRGCHTVPRYAFRDWAGTTAVHLPAELAFVEQGAFYGGGLAVDFDSALALTHIGKFAFRRCWGLQAVTLPASLVVIVEGAFMESSVSRLDLSACSNLVEVDIRAFQGCVGLVTATLGGCSELRHLEESAFAGCTNLASLTLPDELTSVDDEALRACTSLATVAVPSKLETVGRSAFDGCTALVAINLSGCASLRTIDPSAFRGCSALRRVHLPAHFQHEVLELPADCVVAHGPVTQEPVYGRVARWWSA